MTWTLLQVVKLSCKKEGIFMKKAIVYYSYSGNTKSIVDMIKEKVNADIFEIKLKTPYSTDYDEVVDLGQEEVNSNTLREIEDIDINLDNYDTVILATLSSG